MKTFDVETIKDRNNIGDIVRQFKSYAPAKRHAIKESLKEGVIEAFVSGSDDNDMDFEVMEYYSKGKLSIKVA